MYVSHYKHISWMKHHEIFENKYIKTAYVIILNYTNKP